MLFRFCLYGFLKNQRYFEPFLMLVFLQQGLNYLVIGLLIACRTATVNLLEIPSGVLADAWGRRACMISSFVAYIISFLMFASAPHFAWFFPAMMYTVRPSGPPKARLVSTSSWIGMQPCI